MISKILVAVDGSENSDKAFEYAYLSLRIDWAKIIGKWFPWTVEEGDDFKRT